MVEGSLTGQGRLAGSVARVILPLAAILFPPPLAARIIFSEIHYHPAGAPEDEAGLEFLEVFNDEPLPFDVSGYQILGGVTFTFPRGTVVGARGVICVAANPDRLSASYAIPRPLGPFAGRLGNDGDDLVLADTGGSTVSRVHYNDRGTWPAAADGAGPSLVLRDPLLAPSESESWGWSPARGGTPGAVSFETAAPEAVLNEVVRTGAGDGWVEIFNPTRAAVDLSGYRLWGDAAGAQTYTLPPGSLLLSRGFLVVAEAELGFPLDLMDQALYLASADGKRIADARRLGEGVPGGAAPAEGRHPDGAARWYRLAPATRGAPNQLPPRLTVVLSEIHYHPYPGDAEEEFIELANIGGAPADLSGCAFTSGVSFVLPRETLLAPGARLVVARNPERIQDLYGLSGVQGPWQGGLSNSGEMVRLSDAIGNPVDEVRYHTDGAWTRWADGDGPSLELIDLRGEGSAAPAWAASEYDSLPAWTQIEYTGKQKSGDSELHMFLLGAGEVLVDDIEVVPAAGGPNHVPNGGFDGAQPLKGWFFEGTHVESRLEPGGGPDGSNALRIIASKRGDSVGNRVEIQTAPALAAGKDYTVRFKARWLRGSDLIMSRSWNHGLARVSRLPAPRLGGTPGRANSASLENAGPIIALVVQEPALPREGEPVVVRARVSDPDLVARATLRYRLDGADGFGSAELRDDGADPDLEAADGVYAGRLPGMGSRGAAAEFYIEAEAARGAASLSPPEAPARTYIYQYDDAIAAHEVPSYRIAMLKKDHDALTSRSVMSNHDVPASLVFAGQHIFHRAGLRYRGSPYLRRPQITGPRKGIRMRLGTEDPLLGSVRITLDEQEVDPTLQVDRLVRHLLQRAGGIPYGERRHVHLIYRGASFGGYEHVLTVDPLYLERSFGDGSDGGDLYKIDAHYELNDQGEFAFPAFTSWKYTAEKEDLRFIYKKRTREKEDDFSGLMEILDLMDLSRTPDEQFDAKAPAMIDLDLWVKAIAVYRAAEDWDAPGGWTGKNVYLYLHPDGRARLIPWDHDVAFGSAALEADQNPQAYIYTPYFPEVRRLLQRPFLDRKFNAELRRLLREDYDRAVVDPVLDGTYSLLARTTRAAAPTGIKSFLAARRAFLLSKVPAGPSTFAIETNGGEPFATTDPVIVLSGKAPFEVELIFLDTKQASVRWKTIETWEIDASLAPGQNSIALTAFAADGEVLGSDAISIIREEGALFVRGDSNRDGKPDISDAISTLVYLFRGEDLACLDAADVDDSGALDITDPIVLLNFLFRAGAQPPPPFPEPGQDPTQDKLACEGEMPAAR